MYPDPDEIERLSRAAREMLDASAGIMGAYQVWLQTGDSEAAERLDRFDAAWANLHAIAELSPDGHNLRDTGRDSAGGAA